MLVSKYFQRWNTFFATIVLIIFAVISFSCSDTNNPVSGGEDDEESGTELGLDETYNQIRNGVRLIIGYNSETEMFEGTIENTTEQTIDQVRVEIHLSNGKELGPTPDVSLAAGEKQDVTLDASGNTFTGWTPHAEVGSATH